MGLPSECPKCGAALIQISKPRSDESEHVECTGNPRHAFAALRVEGVEPPRYKLGREVKLFDQIQGVDWRPGAKIFVWGIAAIAALKLLLVILS